jgi:hypothetical protein
MFGNPRNSRSCAADGRRDRRPVLVRDGVRLRRLVQRARRDGSTVLRVADHVNGPGYVTLRPGEAFAYWTNRPPDEAYRLVTDEAGQIVGLVPNADT